jgi:myo-inositol-1(or 4)-monophosphatase
MREQLRAAFEQVRALLLREGAGRADVLRRNPRGDVTRAFDELAEECVVQYFRDAVPEPVRILAEEGGELRTRPGAAGWTLVLDPVDGSENFARGNEPVSVSLALAPSEGPVAPDAVEHALVGSVHTGSVCEATRGEGAWRDGARVRASGATELAAALISLQTRFHDRARQPRVYPLLRGAAGVRQWGTAAGEMAAVAWGGVDAFVDPRDTLSPENYMAAALLVREAGGVVTDRLGGPLTAVTSLVQGQSIVAAATPELHAAILRALAEGS